VADPIRDFKLTEDGEWDTSGGVISTVAGEEAVFQGCRVRLRMFAGDCFLDEAVGIDYPNDVLVKNPDELAIKAVLADRLSSVPDVTDVFGAALEVDAATREASISFQIDTEYSENPFSESIGLVGL
jgi:hypothetical protein